MVFVHCERVYVNPPDYIMKQTLEELYAVVELVEDHTTSLMLTIVSIILV